ncbi:MAG: thiamine-phosphate kinase [Candidatus Omnitrophota bacterium]
MLLNKIGEFGLIERFKKHIKLDSSVVKGSGDDCAVIKFTQDKYMLMTCDMIVEGVDFTLKAKPELIGRKAVAISISDIAACGGTPRHCVIAMGIPKNMPVEIIERISQGMFDLAKVYKINIVGGDISRSENLVIDVSMIGEVEKRRLVLRSGAKKGDIIFVSGELGGSIRGKHLSFTPRLKEARVLVNKFKINSMIDISDGLTQDLMHILKESKKGAVIYEDLIPVSLDARGLEEALSMGEDFELLFSASKQEARKIMKLKTHNFYAIGEILGQSLGFNIVDKVKRQKPLRPKGFRHF